MGIKSGSVVASTSGSFFNASNNLNSNCSVKSRAGISSFSSSNHYNSQNAYEIREEREWILNSNIIDLKIGIEPIGSKELHKIVNNEYFPAIRNFYLPAYLGGGTFSHHASCLIKIGFNEYIILEYGGYFGGEPDYKNYIHYWQEDGLRFSRMTYDDYIRKLQNAGPNYYIIDAIFANYMTVGELIRKCCMNGHWRAFDYNLSSNNSQDFIAKVIGVLKVKRKKSYTHRLALVNIPPCILRALEKNEGREALRFFQRIPLVGKFVDIGAQFAELSDDIINLNNQTNELNDQITEFTTQLDKVSDQVDKFVGQSRYFNAQISQFGGQPNNLLNQNRYFNAQISQFVDQSNNLVNQNRYFNAQVPEFGSQIGEAYKY